jgi:hypothetical protein
MAIDRHGDDEIIAVAKKVILSGKTAGPEIQAVMDLVSGVIDYKMTASTNQGWIHKKLIRDRIETNHVIDADALISWFWTGVMKALQRVQVAGTDVPVWYDEISELNGTPHIRATKMSGLNYLRQYGLFMAKRYINETFKKRLRQQCMDCKRISPIGSMREYDDGCVCGAMDSHLNQIGPNKRTRTCDVCHKTRPTRFERVCGEPRVVHGAIEFINGCGSENIVLVTIEEYSHHDYDNEALLAKATDLIAEHSTPESLYADSEIQNEINHFIKECEAALHQIPMTPGVIAAIARY